MFRLFRGWMQRYFSDDEAVMLFVLLLLAMGIIMAFGSMLAPVFAGLVLAFVLQGMVSWLERRSVPHMVSVSLVFALFVAMLMVVLLLLLPLVWDQGVNLLNELPRMVTRGHLLLSELPEKFPGFISEAQVNAWMETASSQVANLGQWIVSFSLSRISGVVGLLIYLVLVPILVFFFLKDRKELLAWCSSMLPKERRMLKQVSEEMSQQIANYIRGKVIEIVIVGLVTFVSFIFLGLNYAALLGLLVGLSVLIPYIGAAIVTIPVAAVGLFQWGMGHDFIILMVVYGVIQALDGNVLVPLLFSEAVNLHPIAIIVAVLLFGGLWGFWGVFFAIPLATLVKAVINAWPGGEEIAAVDL
ncbi:MAG: AI-2E family transporter [Oceanospirillales bacterium LUC14_002_19_P2]|nr:MAG: AI-2E family transporter [Oceanospirillales bacterium LUC14_002_19_P2]